MKLKLFGACALLMGAGFNAQSATLLVSLQDRYLNERIDQLVVLSNIPVLRKPYNVQQVRRHLESIRQHAPGLFREIDRSLRRYESTFSVDAVALSVAKAEETNQAKSLVNARGEQIGSHYRMKGTAHWLASDWIAFSFGGQKTQSPDEFVPIDSYLAFGGSLFQVEVGYREHWWSPFSDWSMMMSTNARPSASLTLSNPEPYESFLNLHYEVFVSHLETMHNIKVGQQVQSGRPYLLGTHLSVSPLDGWVLGFNRTIMFGGADRDTSWGDVWDAFWDPVRNDNNSEVDCDQADRTLCETGDQLASVSNRIDFNGEVPFSVYFEFAGGDSAALSNLRLGNLATQMGFFVPALPSYLLGHDWSFNYEYVEMQNEWYAHHIYRDAYSNEQMSMGHWRQENHLKGDTVGGTGQTIKLGWQMGVGERLDFTYRQFKNDDYGLADYALFREVGLSYYKLWNEFPIEIQLLGGTDIFDDRYSRISLSIGL